MAHQAMMLSLTLCAQPPIPLETAIRNAIQPILQNHSQNIGLDGYHICKDSGWSFAYRDENTSVELCAGYSSRVDNTSCSTSDAYAFGSTTKVMTSVSILRLVEKGLIKSLDEPLVKHANDYFKRISNNSLDLLQLYSPRIANVTLRQLLQMRAPFQEYDNGDVRSYQNNYRGQDLSPSWIFAQAPKKLLCDPGTCKGQYSSTNFVLLGLVLANYQNASDWDRMLQRDWVPAPISNSTANASSAPFSSVKFAIHGLCENFTTADSDQGGTVHGYQWQFGIKSNKTDVFNMSCTQGWTCGNMVARPRDVADFFWHLFGPATLLPTPNSQPQPWQPSQPLLGDAMLAEMLDFKVGPYLGNSQPFGYGLGVMNMSSMSWGFDEAGLFYGHNGLTYGFGAQSGYNYRYRFAVSWVNNCEEWIGPDHPNVPDELYDALVNVVKNYR